MEGRGGAGLARTRPLEDYREFKEYYLDHTPDPARQRAFEEALAPE
jgi:hypothetical protein